MTYFRLDIDDTILEEAVKRAVADFVKNDKEFTAFQITEILRHDVGNSFNVQHIKVRPLVHDLMEGLVDAGFYDRDSQFAVNSTERAIRYYPNDIWLSSSANVKNNVAAAPNVQLAVRIPNIRVKSSVLKGVAYNGTTDSGDLKLKLVSGTYIYKDVPFSAYVQLMNAKSKGAAYNSTIKGIYTSEKVA